MEPLCSQPQPRRLRTDISETMLQRMDKDKLGGDHRKAGAGGDAARGVQSSPTASSSRPRLYDLSEEPMAAADRREDREQRQR